MNRKLDGYNETAEEVTMINRTAIHIADANYSVDAKIDPKPKNKSDDTTKSELTGTHKANHTAVDKLNNKADTRSNNINGTETEITTTNGTNHKDHKADTRSNNINGTETEIPTTDGTNHKDYYGINKTDLETGKKSADFTETAERNKSDLEPQQKLNDSSDTKNEINLKTIADSFVMNKTDLEIMKTSFDNKTDIENTSPHNNKTSHKAEKESIAKTVQHSAGKIMELPVNKTDLKTENKSPGFNKTVHKAEKEYIAKSIGHNAGIELPVNQTDLPDVDVFGVNETIIILDCELSTNHTDINEIYAQNEDEASDIETDFKSDSESSGSNTNGIQTDELKPFINNMNKTTNLIIDETVTTKEIFDDQQLISSAVGEREENKVPGIFHALLHHGIQEDLLSADYSSQAKSISPTENFLQTEDIPKQDNSSLPYDFLSADYSVARETNLKTSSESSVNKQLQSAEDAIPGIFHALLHHGVSQDQLSADYSSQAKDILSGIFYQNSYF